MKLKLYFALLFLSFSPIAVQAGPFTDQLSICLVNQTTPADKQELIKWVYVAISSHPELGSLSNIPKKLGDELNKNVASLFVDLLTSRCRKQAVEAVKYEKNIALQTSFSTLGRVAMQGLMTNPGVANFMGGLDKYIDKEKLQSVFPKDAVKK